MTIALRSAPPVARYRNYAVIGDSQTQAWPTYAVRATHMHVERVAAKLRELGCNIKGRSYGVGGDTSMGCLLRSDDMQIPLYGAPDLAMVYIGVNDPAFQALPTITPASTGGTIAAVGGSLYYALMFVSSSTANGGRLAMPVQTVALSAGSTNSIALAAFTLNTVMTGCDVYISPVGYAAAAAAAAADTRTFRFVTTMVGTGTSYTITAIPGGGAAACPSVSTAANIQAIIKTLKYGVVGYGAGSRRGGIVYADQTQLPANAPPGMRSVVMDDTSATGGMAQLPHTPKAHPTIPGSFVGNAQQTVWERRTPQAGEAGWGRVAVTGTPAFSGCCSMILVLSTNYLNWATGGDNINVDSGMAYVSASSADDVTAGSFYPSYVAVRAQQQAAATAEGIPYVDFFSFQSRLISGAQNAVGGVKYPETVQGSNSWHAIAGNQHHDAYGHDIAARAIVEAVEAQSGWLASLT